MATVPATRTWVAGEVVTAAYFNTTIRDVCNWLLAPAICQVRHAVSQSIANTTWVAHLFDTEDVDTTGMHSTASNTDRVTAVYPGYYRLTGGYGPIGNVTGNRGTRFTLNGAAVNASQIVLTASTLGLYPTRSKFVYLNVGDIVRLEVFQSSGGALGTTTTANEQSSFEVEWRSN